MTRKYPTITSILDDYLQDPQFAADFLLETLAEDDFDVFLLVLKDIQRVHQHDKLPTDEWLDGAHLKPLL